VLIDAAPRSLSWRILAIRSFRLAPLAAAKGSRPAGDHESAGPLRYRMGQRAPR
jgi:hypothetical protein